MKAVDVMGFAGSFAAGVDQAGFDIVSKREPNEFKGFGMDSVLYNMPWIDGQVGAPEEWDLPVEPVELLYGCPPCSGFSQLSHANTLIHGSVVGPDAEINKCMFWLVDYASRVRPQVVIMESVGVAFKSGRDFMEMLWARLVEQSGVDYYLTHVNMNAAWVGGDVRRPRYFFVASQVPFGVGLEFVQPRTAWEVLQDLPAEPEDDDPDWGHILKSGSGVERWIKTLEWLKENGRTWEPGTRLPDNNQDLEPPEFWKRKDGLITKRMEERGMTESVYSHWYSTDPFSTFRWRPDKPYGVVVAAVLERAIHPVHDRPLTFREAARFMSIPDDWSMASLVRRQAAGELGKAVPSASGKWIAHWARMAIEGTPGEYAGVADTDDDRIRVISVQTEAQIAALHAGPPPGTMWSGHVADPDYSGWLIDRRHRPLEWWQREENGGWAEPASAPGRKKREWTPAETSAPPVARTHTSRRAPGPRNGKIVRVEPEKVQALLDGLGIDSREAASRLGVSVSRVRELTTHARPGSWLNEARWEDVKEKLGAR